MAASPYLDRNLSLLRKSDPELAAALERCQATSPSPAPPLSPDGGQWIVNCLRNNPLTTNFICIDFRNPRCWLELAERVGPNLRLIAIEKSLESLKSAFETANLSPILSLSAHPVFVAGDDPANLRRSLADRRFDFHVQGYQIPLMNPEEREPSEFRKKTENVVRTIFRETKVEMQTKAILSRLFQKNIVSNFPHILRTPGINSFTGKLAGIPALIVAAGPSLDKNIHLIRHSADRAIVICVATALKPLLHNGIEPDFVIALDPNEVQFKSFDPEFSPSASILLYDPAVTPMVPALYAGKKHLFDSGVYLYQWLAERLGTKGSLGKYFSVAHCGFLFARYLGCDPVILTGQDLSFNRQRMYCSNSHYYESATDHIWYNRTLRSTESARLLDHSHSLSPHDDVFGNTAATTLALDAYRDWFSLAAGTGGTTINASEGGLPIPGVSGMTLKEALNRYCKISIAERKKSLLDADIAAAVSCSALNQSLREQINWMDELLQLSEATSKSINASRPGDSKEARDAYYRKLLSRNDTILLLQNHRYQEFMQWNAVTHALNNQTGKVPAGELDRLSLDRDRKFLAVIIDSLKYFIEAFRRFEKELTEI